DPRETTSGAAETGLHPTAHHRRAPPLEQSHCRDRTGYRSSVSRPASSKTRTAHVFETPQLHAVTEEIVTRLLDALGNLVDLIQEMTMLKRHRQIKQRCHDERLRTSGIAQ